MSIIGRRTYALGSETINTWHIGHHIHNILKYSWAIFYKILWTNRYRVKKKLVNIFVLQHAFSFEFNDRFSYYNTSNCFTNFQVHCAHLHVYTSSMLIKSFSVSISDTCLSTTTNGNWHTVPELKKKRITTTLRL